MVTILADTAVRGADLDELKAIDAKKRAEEAMRDRSSAMDYARAQAELAEAIANWPPFRDYEKAGINRLAPGSAAAIIRLFIISAKSP